MILNEVKDIEKTPAGQYLIKNVEMEFGKNEIFSEEFGYMKLDVKQVLEVAGDIIYKCDDITDPFVKGFYFGLKPERTITVSEWARKYRYLDSSTSQRAGKYDPDFTPFLVEVMDCLTINNGIKEVILMKSSQVGGTECGNNFIGYVMDVAPGPMMIVQPTQALAKQYSREKVSKIISATPRIRDKVKEKDDNIERKEFPGGFIKMVGANIEKNLRSSSIQYIFFDETDAYLRDVEGKGDPMKIAEARLISYEATSKNFKISSPTIKDFSKIEEEFNRGDKRYYNIPCPHCNGYQSLVFENLKFRVKANNKNVVDKSSIYYECAHCKGEIHESMKTKLMDRKVAKWIATNDKNNKSVVSFHISALYAPLGLKSWESIINEYLEAKDDKLKMKAFYNTLLGLPFKDESHRPDAKKLEKRKMTQFKEWTCPDDVVYVNMGVDTQNNRLAYVVLGYGKNNQVYVIAYEEIPGDTTTNEPWDHLLNISKRAIKHESGIDIFIKDGVIDMGGHRRDMVLDFCRENRMFMPVKGDSHAQGKGYAMRKGENLDKDKDGNVYQNPLYLYLVNTVFNKRIIFDYLHNEDPGKNYIYFNNDLKSEFFEMLCSEEYVVSIHNGKIKEEFVKLNNNNRIRNEVLDCCTYSFALARSKMIHTMIGDTYKEVYEQNILSKKKVVSVVEETRPNPLIQRQADSRDLNNQRNPFRSNNIRPNNTFRK